MRDSKEKIISPTHKVGIKILNDTQMRNVFPNYKDIINHIETHRKWLEQQQIRRFEQYQYNLMYDNVISIFGKRGTGKTSVAFTLHKKLEDDTKHPYDIVLPIIIPEVIPADGSALGWLLAIVKDQVLEFENEKPRTTEESHRKKRSEEFWRNCKVDAAGEDNALSDKLDKLVELFHSDKYNPANELSYNIAIGNSVKQSQNYYEFAKEIVAFWDYWIEAIRNAYKAKCNTEKEIVPFIYFVFDDVDLAPKRVDELLSIIIKYLSHPNIIVIATADEEMFLEVIEERLDRDIGRLPKEWRDFLRIQTIKERETFIPESESGKLVRKTARRYLGKVMPTSTRYYLKLFNTVEEKHLFHLDDGKGLWEGICDQVSRLNWHLEKKEKCDIPNENFLTAQQSNRDYYLNFLGNTSRQIGNAYIGIKDFIDSLQEIIRNFKVKTLNRQEPEHRSYIEEIYNCTWRFLYISVNSNHDLAERLKDVESFLNEMFWLEHNEWFLYINYAYLDDYIQIDLSELPKIEQVKMALQLYSLFHFTENVFLILENCTQQGITERRRIHGVSYLSAYLCAQVFDGRQRIRQHMTAGNFFSHYRTLLNRLERLMDEGLQEKKRTREYFYDFTELTEEVPEKLILEAFRTDRDWLWEISGMLSMVYGNLYLIGEREFESCRLYEPEEALTQYQTLIKDLLDQEIYKVLDVFDCLTAAKNVVNEKEIYSGKDGGVKRTIKELAKEYAEELIKADEPVNEKQKKAVINMMPAYYLIERINRKLQKMEIYPIIELLPIEEASDIRFHLEQENIREGMFYVLRILYNSILEWDNKEHSIYVDTPGDLYNVAYAYRGEADCERELRRLTNYIYQYIPKKYEKSNESWLIKENFVYTKIKERLNYIGYTYRRKTPDIEELLGFQEDMEWLAQKIDVGIRLDDENELEDALCLAIKVHLAIRIERLYLYYSIVEKYDRNYEYASSQIEYTGTEKDDFHRTYYYKLFSQMSHLMEKDQKKLSNEERMVRSFIGRAASQNRKEYIRSMLHEVNDESFTD